MQTKYLSEHDEKQLQELGIARAVVENQLRRFESGFPYLNIILAANPENGIKVFTTDQVKHYLHRWEEELEHSDDVIMKFVPASGAASRMFKSLYSYLLLCRKTGESLPPQSPEVQEFFAGLDKFAFYDALNEASLRNEWVTVSRLNEQKKYQLILENLLTEKGLNYGSLPKGMLLFHDYKEGPRTAAEEHLAEGVLYAMGAERNVHVHFTVSPEHLDAFRSLLLRKLPKFEEHFSARFDVSYSVQKSETDTIAVDKDNVPFRSEDGRLLFRPGGHGALIENLNDLDADILFIKNIDNVVPDRYKCDTIIYKKVLGGYLVSLREKVYGYMRMLSDDRRVQSATIEEIRKFLLESFFVRTDTLEGHPTSEMVEQLKRILNRPIRVCGMVRNEGQPGGGPYVVKDEKGYTGLQILESTQINKDNPADVEIMETAEYFNPVDLVCCVKDYEGRKFNLKAFVDEETGFISYKSKNGIELKALELPGLWNGAMAGWNTSFVEVPVTTFNPVKTVNDLLQPTHQ